MSSSKEKQIVIKAINNLGRCVSAADVAAETGLPVASAVLTLNQVASETGGHLQVSKVGDIAYQFPFGYQTRYIASGVRRLLEQFGQQAFTIAFFLLRISFGIMLVLSLLIIVLAIFIVVFSASRGRDDDELSFNFDFFDWMILRELLFWEVNYPVLTYGNDNPAPAQNQKKSNFLYNCFSFLFGDGNPNANVSERRWQEIAKLIRENHGALTVEQLAPYTGSDPNNEDSVLSVLVRFDGQPVVTDSGNIIYIFPSLQATAEGPASKGFVERLGREAHEKNTTPYFSEFAWQFSQVDTDDLLWVIALAALNFVGSWWLYLHAAKYSLIWPLVPLSVALVIYGTLFVLVPLLRFLAISLLNTRIQARNRLRHSYALALNTTDKNLQNKLAEARTLRLAARQIKPDDVIYTTQKDTLEQEFPLMRHE